MKLRLCVGLFAILAVLATTSIADEKAPRLPTYYSKLGLTEKQKSKILEIRSANIAKIEGLEKQIQDIKKKEKEECEAVLTDGQRDRLQEIMKEKGKGEDTKAKKDDKSKDEDKN